MGEAVIGILESGQAVVVALVALSVALWSTVTLRFGLLWRAGVSDPGRRMQEALEQEFDHPLNIHHGAQKRGVVDRAIVEAAHVMRLHAGDARRLDTMFRRASKKLGAHRGALRAMSLAAPLLGLLGTVDGMIETFASLHVSVSTMGQEASVAGGISRALVSTQLGLAIGIPALVATRLLERREAALRRQLCAVRSMNVVDAEVRREAGDAPCS